MEGDPRISKPRLPKAYTEEQLVFLRSHISGFETRTRGHVRGDAKKFALDRATEFLLRFGLPPDLQGVDEAEPRFREQIYNWYKNTVGRARRKLEGRARPKKLSDKGPLTPAAASSPLPVSTSATITWSPTLSAAFSSAASDPPDAPGPSPHLCPHSHSTAQQQTQTQQQQPQSTQQLQFTFKNTLPVPVQVTPSPSPITLSVTPSALRDAFVAHTIDAPTLSSILQSYVLAHPSPTPLTPIVHALFEAATSLLACPAGAAPISTPASAAASGPSSASTTNGGHARGEVLHTLLRRFVDACAFFPATLVHADASGPLAGPRALQTALRKSSVWAPVTASPAPSGGTNPAVAIHGSLSDEMERIKADRQRRKDHVHWAQIHAAAIELGVLRVAGSHASPHAFSEMMVRDAVWEADEVEWVAGIIVLRAIIRTTGASRKAEWEQLLGAYERRWKEIKDEARQALVTEVLLGARDDLAHLDETR